ncbi:MAG: hypothetical protein E7583_03040 [Ruminococcaceae bacterium]|nr:hypothetical protein [Oscillospiraceae bacterium]
MIDGYARYEVPYGSFNINEFRGYNATPARMNSEMSEMTNLSSGYYPYLSPRRSRNAIQLPEGLEKIDKVFRANGKLTFIADGKLWYDGRVVGYVDKDTEKSIAICNGKICIAPDLVFYDYINDIFGRMDGRVSIVPGYGRCLELCGNEMRVVRDISSLIREDFPWQDYLKVGDSIRMWNFTDAAFNPRANGEYHVLSFSENGECVYLDNDFGTDALYPNTTIVINNKDVLVFEMNDILVDQSTNKITFSFHDGNFGAPSNVIYGMRKFAKYFFPFTEGDVLKIGNISDGEDIGDEATEYVITDIGISSTQTEFTFSGSQIVPTKVGDGGAITITRTVPKLSFICENDNRLFGVCSDDNTVVASRLGHPLNFRYFSGTSMDSFSVEVGSDGEFTGIAPYAGDIVLFKERHIHLLSGSKPSMYRLQGIETYGCQRGCSESICSLSGRLFYKSLRGVYVFSGSFPECISKKLGEGMYTEAFAADDDRRYYISMKDQKGVRHLYVYDTDYGFWYIEDGTDTVSMCELSGDIYIADRDNCFRINDGDEAVRWSAVLGPFDLYSEKKKIVSSIAVRYSLFPGSSMRIEISYDGGAFEMMKEVFYCIDTALVCEIPIRRCDGFSIRLSGNGDVRIKGISSKLRESMGGKS